eukprot:3809300-Amphidinium_carterae.1
MDSRRQGQKLRKQDLHLNLTEQLLVVQDGCMRQILPTLLLKIGPIGQLEGTYIVTKDSSRQTNENQSLDSGKCGGEESSRIKILGSQVGCCSGSVGSGADVDDLREELQVPRSAPELAQVSSGLPANKLLF